MMMMVVSFDRDDTATKHIDNTRADYDDDQCSGSGHYTGRLERRLAARRTWPTWTQEVIFCAADDHD